ncbi:uncharacterized protein METZ01_LOCUS453960, partial [marine metagenome]
PVGSPRPGTAEAAAAGTSPSSATQPPTRPAVRRRR